MFSCVFFCIWNTKGEGENNYMNIYIYSLLLFYTYYYFLSQKMDVLITPKCDIYNYKNLIICVIYD